MGKWTDPSGENGHENYRLLREDDAGHKFYAETLIGRIGEGKARYVGNGIEFVADEAGSLMFRCNEKGTPAGLGDNEGDVKIIIKVTPAK